jgi:hypothetical protein
MLSERGKDWLDLEYTVNRVRYFTAIIKPLPGGDLSLRNASRPTFAH